jgi:hypothetical protein
MLITSREDISGVTEATQEAQMVKILAFDLT